ncbi:WD40 repeat domain-containing protein [Protofrankia symbiont of Coriaria ruscifolia]|uniref:WD40 repeat-containing protein n=1 Tax=Candidatus Protofrankia californiensis TaxID=1839754 RepID=A0A1C3NYD9_9ACTN|nr:hypothetical protein [Protofrankia symbiont of Coriaria ruscifolia]SBW22557.1 WD40 repeat-containing protein [Candidatus Protofrankia californiensis]
MSRGPALLRAAAGGMISSEPVWSIDLDDAVSAVAAGPRGSLAAAASLSGRTTVVDTDEGVVVTDLPRHEMGALAVAWAPDGQRLAVGGADGSLVVSDLARCQHDAVPGRSWVHALAWSPDGSYLAAGRGREVLLLRPDATVVARWPGQPSTVTALAWVGGRLAVACYGGIRWYDPQADGTAPVRTFDWKGSLLALAVASNGRWVASGNQDASIHLWRLWSGEDYEMAGYPAKVTALAFDPGSRRLAAGGAEEVTVWNLGGKGPGGRRPDSLRTHTRLVVALAYAPAPPPPPAGRRPAGPVPLASGGRDGVVAVWRGTGSSRRPALRVDLGAPVGTVAWRADAALLLAGTEDGRLHAIRPPGTPPGSSHPPGRRPDRSR